MKGMKGGPGRPEEIGALWGGDLGKRLEGRPVGLPMAELEARLDGPERQGRKWDADTCGDPEPAGWRPLGHLLSEGHKATLREGGLIKGLRRWAPRAERLHAVGSCAGGRAPRKSPLGASIVSVKEEAARCWRDVSSLRRKGEMPRLPRRLCSRLGGRGQTGGGPQPRSAHAPLQMRTVACDSLSKVPQAPTRPLPWQFGPWGPFQLPPTTPLGPPQGPLSSSIQPAGHCCRTFVLRLRLKAGPRPACLPGPKVARGSNGEASGSTFSGGPCPRPSQSAPAPGRPRSPLTWCRLNSPPSRPHCGQPAKVQMISGPALLTIPGPGQALVSDMRHCSSTCTCPNTSGGSEEFVCGLIPSGWGHTPRREKAPGARCHWASVL